MLDGTRRRLDARVAWLLLAAILAGAAALRLTGVNWDQGHHVHPDERWISIVASQTHWPEEPERLLAPRGSPLNPFWGPEGPRNFAYGHFPLYLLRGTASALAWLAGRLDGLPAWAARAATYDAINLVGRYLSAAADLVTILLVYLIGQRLYGRRVGLVAALLLGATVLHIQLSHYYAVDALQATLVVATLLLAVRLVQAGGAANALGLGAFLGLSVASKFSSLPLLLPVALAALLASRASPGQLLRRPARLEAVYPLSRRGESVLAAELRDAVLLLALVLAVALAVFALTSPFALLDSDRFLSSIRHESAMVRGTVDLPYTRQYRGTIPFLYQAQQLFWFGMGPTLLAISLVGLGLALWRAGRGRGRPEEWVLLAWVVPYLLITGPFMVKFPRYNVLVTPLLVLLGAQALVEGARSLGRRGGALLVGLVLLPTLAWAVAFTSIYTRPLSRVEASEWIYRNIPAGATLTADSWDDRLPFDLPVDGEYRASGEYRYFTTLFYEPDGEEKLQHILQLLREADYIVVSSNRLYGWLPRLEHRYPVSARYFELLFDGRLGFEKIQEFTSYPRLGPLRLVDDRLDESLTVYDHPKVMIFARRQPPSEAELRPLFAAALERAARPADPDLGAYLLRDDPEDLPVVAERGWNQAANRSSGSAVLMWWLALLLLGLVGLPLGATLFPDARDAGYLPGRLLALLGSGYLVWLAASLGWAPYTLWTAWGTVALVGVVAWLVWLRRRRRGLPWRGLLLGEGVFGAAFLLLVGVRLLNPDLWQPWLGGEKFMEMAYLQAILKSAHFPPYNPYFAGTVINYYYYGLYLMSFLVRLTGIVPEVAFNLAVPTLFALTVGGAFWLGRELGGSAARGLVAAALVTVLGNLDGLVQLGEGLSRAAGPALAALPAPWRWLGGLAAVATGSGAMGGFDFWRSSRVVPNTINEFPYFSFLFADLHPHMIGIPFVLLVVALGWRAWKGLRGLPALPALYWLALPLAAGAVAVINTWDLPVTAALVGGSLVAAGLRQRRGLLLPVGAALAVVLVSVALYAPFYLRYRPQGVGLGWVNDPTGWRPFLTMWGLFLFLAYSGLAARLWHRPGRSAVLRSLRLLLRRPGRLIGRWRLVRRGNLLALALLLPLAAGLPAAGLFLAGRPAAAVAWPPVVLGAALALSRGRDGPGAFGSLLVALGAGILVGVELVYLRDFLGGSPWYRMNTVFKFWIQAWVMLGLGCALLLGSATRTLDRSPRLLRWGWGLAAGFLILGAAIYPLWATPVRVSNRFPEAQPPLGTLDGMAFMELGRFRLPEAVGGRTVELRHEAEAIRWLQARVVGTPVIAEAPLGYYREAGGRVATLTGLPTLLGMHQSEQLPPEMVGRRDAVARRLFSTTDPAEVLDLIRRLRVRYVYVGQLERSAYGQAAAAAFDALTPESLELVYRNAEVSIYRVPEEVSP